MTAALETPEWLVNTAALEDLARYITVDEGMQETPESRDTDVVIPGADGDLDVGMDPTAPRRTSGPGRITFSGLVKGVDPVTGLIGYGDSWDLYLRRVDELVDLFSPRRLVIDHVRPDGVRRAVGKLIGSVAVTRERTSPVLGRWKAVVKIPAAFWSAVDPVTISATLSSGGALPLGALGVGNAPITDAVLRFGPGNNPTLVQSGTYLGWDGVIAAGRQLAVDVAARECGPGVGAAWSPADSAIRYGPGYPWFDLDPNAGALTLNHTGGGQMTVSVTARPKYKTS